MFIDTTSRRAFLKAAGAAGAAWILADAADIQAAFAQVARRRSEPPPYRFDALTAAQATDLEAVCARILPAVGAAPGAREAGAIHFIDRGLASFNAAQKPLFDEGIADLNRRAAARWPGTASFAALSAERQDELLRAIEQQPFFGAVHFATIAGTFADPSWGGNRDHAGFAIIGHGHEPAYQPPFGWYDSPANRGG